MSRRAFLWLLVGVCGVSLGVCGVGWQHEDALVLACGLSIALGALLCGVQVLDDGGQRDGR